MLSLNNSEKTRIRAQFGAARLDIPAFLKRYKPCEMSQCEAMCCHAGTILKGEESTVVSTLMAQHADALRVHLPDLSDQPFEKVRLRATGEIVTMTDIVPHQFSHPIPEHFESMRCVFTTKEGFCGLQLLSVEHGHHPWWYKPMDCWLHPIALLTSPEATITIPTPENDPYRVGDYPGFTSYTECGCSTEKGEPAYESLAEELAMLGTILGRDLLGEIHAHRAEKP